MSELLKDRFFTDKSVRTMAGTIKKAHRRFDSRRFIRLVFDDSFEGLELKQRMRHTTECLHETLPGSYQAAVRILMKSAPEIRGFEAMCLPDYVEMYGLNDWALSRDALTLFTKYSSSEFAIRPFIKKSPRRAMAFMRKLAKSKDSKVRRFASEGCRPRLPWAMALPAFKRDPGPVLRVLELLKDDESEFVRRSVANNLNDISKDNPEVILDICEAWFGKSERTDWIVKHACRTLLKAGDKRAMLLFGFGDPKRIDVNALRLSKKTVTIGQKLEFSFTVSVRTKKASKVRLEYVVDFARASGKNGKKVFQISEKMSAPGEHRTLRKHSFENMSTRKHFPGKHEIAIKVNGVEKARVALRLVAP